MVGGAFFCEAPRAGYFARDPFKALFVLGALCDLHRLGLYFVVFVVFQKVAVDVPHIDELDIRAGCSEVEGRNLDGSYE